MAGKSQPAPSPAPTRWGSLPAGILAGSRGIRAAWLLISLELLVVAAVGQQRFASVWELQFGALWLGPVALALAGLAGLVGSGVRGLLSRGTPTARWAASALFGVGAALTGWGVGGGRLLAGPGRRAGFALALGCCAVGLVWWAYPRVTRWRAERPRRFAAAIACAILCLELANAWLLVRLYPAFHLSLAVLCVALAALAWPAISGASVAPTAPRGRKARLLGALGVWAVWLTSFAVAAPAAKRLATFDNFRLVLMDRAPLLGQAVLAAGVLAPPPPVEDCAGAACWDDSAQRKLSAKLRGAADLDWRGRDLLLISVDALRADHVGSYGYDRPTTPNIDGLAKAGQGYTGVVFDAAYCPTPHTSYSVTSLMTGKYMRPLLLQGAGADSDTWASILRTYGYRTAAFFPPAVFFIDRGRFAPFEESQLGFEYAKKEFLEGEPRVAQLRDYLAKSKAEQRVFAWVHLFGPHEPYEAHPGLGFGDRDIDRYDSEIAAADRSIGALVQAMRSARPNTVVIITADHGEEFGDHGGRYHGTSVYEEQVRVPLVISMPSGKGVEGKTLRVRPVVQTIDLLPTVLSALDVPVPPRVRGRDLGPSIASAADPTQVEEAEAGGGFALVETETESLLAEGDSRLICERRLGACQLFDLSKDPGQLRPINDPERLAELHDRLKRLGASHGRFEQAGKRAEGKGWPAPILRGISGDGDAALEIAGLLDDADVEIRRKAAEILFELRRPEAVSGLELALRRDEDQQVKRYAALALTRLGRGAPLSYELLKSPELRWRRLAALALAESGDARGEAVLIAWWKDAPARDFERSLELLAALGKLRSKDAVWPLVLSLSDVRLRPHIARALAEIGEDVARVPLAKALEQERYQSTRVALTQALIELGAEAELARPLIHFLGVPDPLVGGLGYALQAKILDRIGGPSRRELAKLEQHAHLGVHLLLVVPRGGNGQGVRVLVRARSPQGGKVYVGSEQVVLRYNRLGEPQDPKDLPRIDPERSTSVELPPSAEPLERWARLADSLGAKPGKPVNIVVFAERGVELLGLALVPLSDELPPPAAKPWKAQAGEEQKPPI